MILNIHTSLVHSQQKLDNLIKKEEKTINETRDKSSANYEIYKMSLKDEENAKKLVPPSSEGKKSKSATNESLLKNEISIKQAGCCCIAAKFH